jgi:hypothetical protein
MVDETSLRSKPLNVSATILPMRSAPNYRQPLSRTLGLKPLKISVGLKRLLYSVALAVPCALIATGISDSAAVSNLLRYAISPGTALAIRVVHPEPSHRGLGVFLDALNWYGQAMSVAFIVNELLYGLFIFGSLTTISALNEKRPAR